MSEKKKIGNLDLGSIDDMKLLASDLGKFIRENKLFNNVGGKEFVNVEGWMYAGSRLGLTSYTEDVWDKSTEEEIKYMAKIVVENIETGKKVGQGYAVCSNKEQGKKYYQEYAIISMAQTRGIGKAYRLFLAQLIRLAGFEPTPAEEMDGYDAKPEAAPAKKTPAKKAAAAPAEAPAADSTGVGEEHQKTNEKGELYATDVQKKKLMELMQAEVISKEERTKVMLKLNVLTTDEAADLHLRMKDVIKKREDELMHMAEEEKKLNGKNE